MAPLRARLDALREKLLDLSFRNRLLNYSDTGRRVLKVRRLSLGELYTALVEDGKTLTIAAKPVEAAVNRSCCGIKRRGANP